MADIKTSRLLREDGSRILQESGYFILLEQYIFSTLAPRMLSAIKAIPKMLGIDNNKPKGL